MRAVSVAFGISVVGSLLLAQSTERIAPIVERIEVSVTNVDVVVTDPAGRPVSGLTRNDFEIFEDGVPQKVTNFYAIEDATVRLARSGDAEGSIDPDQFRRKIVLLIDNNFIQKPSRDAALAHLDEFIESHPAANVQWTLITIGRSVTTVQPFTADRKELHAAIERVRHMPVFDQQRVLDRAILSDPVRRAGLSDPFTGINDFGASVRFRAREQTMRNLNATQNTARAVIQACRGFSATEGKKVIVLVTGGMEMNTTFKAFETPDDRVLADMKQQTGEILDAIVREANAANVNLYVVNGRSNRGMIAPQHDVANKSAGINTGSVGSLQDAMGSGPVDVSDVDSSSRILASGTGGLYLPASDVAANLERIENETASYYSLGFSPTHGEDGLYHNIKVRVNRPGVDVRYRRGYLNHSMHERLEQSLLSPMSFPKEKGSLPVKLVVGIPASHARALSVPVTAELPMNLLTIVPHANGYSGRVHVYVSVYDAGGNNVGYHHFIRDVNLTSEEFGHVTGSEFRYQGVLGLRPGEFTILVTLRDDVTNELGSAMQILHL